MADETAKTLVLLIGLGGLLGAVIVAALWSHVRALGRRVAAMERRVEALESHRRRDLGYPSPVPSPRD